jgi:fatty-acyl-CoA synthase
MGGAGDQKDIMLLLECRTRDQKLLDEIYSSVMTAIRLEVGVPVRLQLVPKGTMIITSSGKLSRARVKAKFLKGEIIDIQADRPVAVIGNETA